MAVNAIKYEPDYAVSPGEILEETLEAKGMKKSELAERCGLSDKHVSQIIAGKAPVTPETAIHLDRVLGISASIWNNLEAAYRLHAAREREMQRIESQKAWVKRFPVAAMVKRGWIDKPSGQIDAAEKLLRFLGVASVESWEQRFSNLQAAFRRACAFQSEPESVAAWLRMAELKAAEVETDRFQHTAFTGALHEIRSLTQRPAGGYEPIMKRLCAESGVALVFVSELPKTRLSGAAKWLTKEKALIALSFRYKRNDHFWFSFFHEAGHIVKHRKTLTFIDGEQPDNNEIEREADAFAMNLLIPRKEFESYVSNLDFSAGAIRHFARRLGVAPGIVVGRLQHEKYLPHNYHQNLKVKVDLTDQE